MPAAVPLPDLMAVVVRSLPLTVDHLEDEAVYGCLVEMLDRDDRAVLGLLPKIVSVFARVLHKSSVRVCCARARGVRLGVLCRRGRPSGGR